MLRMISQNGKSKLILFIHGLTGSTETWVNNDGQHFGELLGTSDKISTEYDIAEYEYHTKILDISKMETAARFLFGKKKDKAVKKIVDINDVSEILKSELDVMFNNYEQIVLIVHSMGGLVGKSYILKCLEEGLNHKCPMMISLAVPHKGSVWASYGKVVSNKQIYDLEPLSDFLDSIEERWEAADEDLLPAIICAYGKHDSVVKQNSASPKVLKNKIKDFPCDEDHTSISKPISSMDVIYLLVVKSISEYNRSIQLKNEFLLKELEDATVYNDEDFVIKLIIADIHESSIRDAKDLYYNADVVNRAYRDSDSDLAILKDIYIKIRVLYRTLFIDYQSGVIKSSSELLNEVYKKIASDNEGGLRTSLPYINEFHKKGMIHHLANKSMYGIWWSLGHCQKDIDNMRR